MNRRRFFELMGWAVAAPVAYSFIGSGSVYVPSRGLLASTNLTLAEWAKSLPVSPAHDLSHLLAQTNEILHDVVFEEAGPFHHWENPNQGEVYGRSPGDEAREQIEAMNRATFDAFFGV